jgi:hypothetical protein
LYAEIILKLKHLIYTKMAAKTKKSSKQDLRSLSAQDILKNIENGGEEPAQHAHGDEIVVGVGEEQVTGGFDSATTKPDPETQPVATMFKKGPDIHGNMGDHRPRQAGLPRAQMENLVSHLSTLYQEVKGR